MREKSTGRNGMHNPSFLVGIPGLNMGQVTDGYRPIAGFKTGSAFYFLHVPTYLPTYVNN